MKYGNLHLDLAEAEERDYYKSLALKNSVSEDLYIQDRQDFSIQIPTVVEGRSIFVIICIYWSIASFCSIPCPASNLATLSLMNRFYIQLIMGLGFLWYSFSRLYIKSWGHLTMQFRGCK